MAKWQTRLAQTQPEQSVPVQIRSSVSVDLAQPVQHRPRNPAGEVIRHEGSTPSIHTLCRHGGTGIHTCPRSKRESMWVRIPLTALRRFGRVVDCGSLENCRPVDSRFLGSNPRFSAYIRKINMVAWVSGLYRLIASEETGLIRPAGSNPAAIVLADVA